MKTWLLLITLSCFFPLRAQQPTYQDFETDSAAEPHGGIAYLNTFLQTNLRKPTSVAAKGFGGRVIVKGIVETDGRVSDVTVAQSLHSELNQEAIRVFSRFHAWKPARKGGQVVRQVVNLPVTFKPNAPFTYANGIQTDYFGADRTPVTDSTQARYKKASPMDERGLPTGDVIVYERKRSGWKETNRLPLVRLKGWQGSSAGQPLYLIGNQDAGKQWQDAVHSVDEAGNLFHQTEYENGMPSGFNITYHANGLVEQITGKENETRFATTSWYANGQMKESSSVDQTRGATFGAVQHVTLVWDSTGRQLVRDGNGRAVYTELMQSYRDTAQRTPYREEGLYEGGLKQGTWTGRYADGSYFYEERYDKGICQSGKAITAGQDTVRYTTVEQQPEFAGGMPKLGQFLAQNLRYPADAQRARAQGRVFVSFVVCQDGTLCDYEVIKSVQSELDKEALRVVKAMSGRWKPGSQRGQAVRVKYNLPINFTLE